MKASCAGRRSSAAATSRRSSTTDTFRSMPAAARRGRRGGDPAPPRSSTSSGSCSTTRVWCSPATSCSSASGPHLRRRHAHRRRARAAARRLLGEASPIQTVWPWLLVDPGTPRPRLGQHVLELSALSPACAPPGGHRRSRASSRARSCSGSSQDFDPQLVAGVLALTGGTRGSLTCMPRSGGAGRRPGRAGADAFAASKLEPNG